jgi:integrase
MPLFDEGGERIRGKENREAAERALARERLSLEGEAVGGTAGHGPWLVARVCSEYIQYCERGVVKGTISKGHRDNAVSWLNDLCEYCGALPVGQLKKGQIKMWLESHTTWRSSATHRSVMAIVLAAFNRAEELRNVANPLKGMKKPPSKPRLHSFSEQDEKALYGTTEPCFGNFLLTLIHTGLRPFCELARITADDVEETDRGMMWRVDSSKNKKTRKIPVRPEVAELTRKLMKTAPRGSGIPLFRNTKGRPWKRMTGVVRFLVMKKKLGWDTDPVKTQYSCYTCRHTFAHRMLSGYWTDGVGCSIETLAELMGDTPKVAFDHYGKEWGQHYQDPLWAAIGEGSKVSGRPTQGRGKSQKAGAPGSKQRPSSDRSGSKRKKRGPKSTTRRRERTSR